MAQMLWFVWSFGGCLGLALRFNVLAPNLGPCLLVLFLRGWKYEPLVLIQYILVVQGFQIRGPRKVHGFGCRLVRLKMRM